MTGLRTSGMRRRVCVSCQAKFIPKRLDAETCSNRCRQAQHRKRDARAKAESFFKTREQIANNTADLAFKLEKYQDLAAAQNVKADSFGHKHIRFMGTAGGVLAVQGYRENDLPWPVPWKPARWFFGLKELKHDPCDPGAGDPEVIDAVVYALKHQTPLGASFIRREYEKECQALLRGPVRRISLFVADPDWRDKPPPGGWPRLPTDWADDDWDDEPYGPGETVFYAVADEDEPPPENIGIEDRDWYADEECHPMERDWGGPPVTDN